MESGKVAVQIPKKDRGKTDMSRMAAFIVKLSRSCYNLAVNTEPLRVSSLHQI